MAITRHDIKAGDTPTLRWSLGRDITGETARLIVVDHTSRAGKIDAAVTITDATTGTVSYQLGAAALPVGLYDVEVECTKAGVVLTHPSTGYGSISVWAGLG